MLPCGLTNHLSVDIEFELGYLVIEDTLTITLYVFILEDLKRKFSNIPSNISGAIQAFRDSPGMRIGDDTDSGTFTANRPEVGPVGSDKKTLPLDDQRALGQYVGSFRSFGPKTLALSTHNPSGLFGDRARLIDEYLLHWKEVAIRLELLGRMWRPDAACFSDNWHFIEGDNDNG